MTVTPIRPKWAGTLTNRERFTRQMHRQPVDRSFNMEFGYWQENFQTWEGFLENGITNNAEADVFFNFDPIRSIGGQVWLHPQFEERVLSETEDRKLIINRDGLIGELPKDGHSTIPHFTDTSVKTPADWQKVKAERLRFDDPARTVDIDKLKAQHPADRTYPLGVHCGSMIGKIRDMLSFEGLAYAVYDYPEMVEDMVETSCLLVEHALDQLLPHFDFDFASGWEDIAFKNGPIVSLPFFQDVIVPRYARIGEKLRAAGVDIWYTDCDGDVRPLIPGFLEAGLNTMFPFEVNSSGHPGETLERYGEQIQILGGVDKTKLIAGRKATKEYVESLVPYVEAGGFIPFCDHRCPPDVDYEDYLYYLDLKEELFGV
jgi:uroporphyrinogen decarboxylase